MTDDKALIAAARRLAPQARAASDEAERLRQTPPDLAAEITRAGIYQMYLPRAVGGPEAAPLTAFEVIEKLSKADGSVGWCAMIATSQSLNVSRLPVAVARAMAGTPADFRAAGSARPGGRAHAVPGGYRVSGRWNFASGLANARWLSCTSFLMDGEAPQRDAANALGIARGAIDNLTRIAETEASTMSPNKLRDRPMVQARVAEADAIVSAARAFVFDAVGRVWAQLCAGARPSDADIARGGLAIVHGMHEAVRAVDKVFHAAGTNAVYTRLPLERAFRDVHVAVQHAAALPGYYESAGKVLLGVRPEDVGWG